MTNDEAILFVHGMLWGEMNLGYTAGWHWKSRSGCSTGWFQCHGKLEENDITFRGGKPFVHAMYGTYNKPNWLGMRSLIFSNKTQGDAQTAWYRVLSQG